jgi:hypothetical protein
MKADHDQHQTVAPGAVLSVAAVFCSRLCWRNSQIDDQLLLSM